ncbi:aldo/keto reductase [Nitrospira sp. Nam74]
MGNVIREGKIHGWGQSQAIAEQIRRAHAVSQLTAVQNEYSMMERMFERDVIPLCNELRIGFVAFSPLAGGFLSRRVRADNQCHGDDVTRVITRFDKANIVANQPLVDLLHRFADEKGATPPRFHSPGCSQRKTLLLPFRCSRKRRKRGFKVARAGEDCLRFHLTDNLFSASRRKSRCTVVLRPPHTTQQGPIPHNKIGAWTIEPWQLPR